MELKDQKILVTGAAGFVGTHVMNALRKRGVPEANISAPRSAECNLLVMADCGKAVKGIDLVIHLAGLTGGGDYHKKHPGEIFYGNVVMGANIMEAARAAGVKKFVFAGSVAEYPASAPTPIKEESLWDGFPEPSHAPYAIAKRALLEQGQAYRAEYGFNVIHLLLSNMYGPFAKPGSGPIPMFIGRVAEAKKDGSLDFTIWGTGKATRDFIYIEDAAEAIMLVTEKYDKPEPVNIGSGIETSIGALAQAVMDASGFKGTLKYDVEKSNDTTRRVLDVSRAEKEFGFRAQTSLAEGLRKTIEWYNGEHG